MSFVKLPVDNVVEFLNTKRFTVTWSGGKDSTSTLLWVLDNIKHEDWDIIYIEITGNTHPLCTAYVLEVAKQLGVYNKLKIVKNNTNFFDLMKRYGIPYFGYRWCYSKFKFPFFRSASMVQVNGMRAKDSPRRGKTLSEVLYSKVTDKIWVMPLWSWSKQDVLAYIKKHGVGINPCYDRYGHSGNCMFCPYHDKNSIIKTLRDPEWGPKIIETLRSINRDSEKMKRIKERWIHIWQLLQARKPLVRA